MTPYIAERGLTRGRQDSSTLDLLLPKEVKRLEPGDFIEATIEHVTIPQFAKDYYGPNVSLREALSKNENTWKMVHREAVGNARKVEVKTGKLRHRFPDVRIAAEDDVAEFIISGGLGYVPLTITGLSGPRHFSLTVDGKKLDQSVHGKDFWQTDFDPVSQTWSQTYNVPFSSQAPKNIRISPQR